MRIQRSIHFLLFLFVMLAIPATSFAQIGVSITVAPPELVAYSQPICPQEGYLWTPGYWAYGRRRLFLGARHMGRAARGWLALDSRLLGLGQ